MLQKFGRPGAMPPRNTRTPDRMCKETSLPEQRQVWLQHSTGTSAEGRESMALHQQLPWNACEGPKVIHTAYLTSAIASSAFLIRVSHCNIPYELRNS